jgi:hypothetical protein
VKEQCDMCGCWILGQVHISTHGKTYCYNCHAALTTDPKDVMIEYLCTMWAAHIMIAKGVSRGEAKAGCLLAAQNAVMNGWKDELGD